MRGEGVSIFWGGFLFFGEKNHFFVQKIPNLGHGDGVGAQVFSWDQHLVVVVVVVGFVEL